MIILTSIIRDKSQVDKKTEFRGGGLRSHKENLIVALSLAAVFGLGWGFGLLSTSYPSEAVTLTFQVVFSVFVGFQGILLFLLHGVRNIDARRVWKHWLTCCGRRSSRFAGSSSKSVSRARESINYSQTPVSPTLPSTPLHGRRFPRIGDAKFTTVTLNTNGGNKIVPA